MVILLCIILELTCGECNTSFSSAASLLKHFAQHASQADSCSSDKNPCNKKATIPDLYPISSFKTAFKQNKPTTDEMLLASDEMEDNVDSGVEDLVNPLRYYSINLKDRSPKSPDNNESTDNIEKSKSIRKYKCSFCLKTFGWSTDLKRHTLTHTGERPFKCTKCDSTFTRKFLLQKHYAKQHNDVSYDIVHSGMLDGKIKLPALKPISFILKRKSRKQDKQKIRRKILNTKNLYQSINGHFEVADNLICSE